MKYFYSFLLASIVLGGANMVKAEEVSAEANADVTIQMNPATPEEKAMMENKMQMRLNSKQKLELEREMMKKRIMEKEMQMKIQREEMKGRMEEKRMKVEEKKGEIKAKLDQKREDLKEKKSEMKENFIEKRKEQISKRVGAGIKRLETLIVRIDSRIAKLEAEGKNTAKAKELIASAKAKIAELKSKAESLKALKLEAEAVANADFKTNVPLFAEIEKGLKDVHVILIQAVKALGFANVGVKAEVNAAGGTVEAGSGIQAGANE